MSRLHSELDAIRECVDAPTRAELDAVDRIIASMPTLAVVRIGDEPRFDGWTAATEDA